MAAPAAPTALTASNIENTQLTLTWVAPAAVAVTGYHIQKSLDNGANWQDCIADTGNALVTYNVTRLRPATNIQFRVAARAGAVLGLYVTVAVETADHGFGIRSFFRGLVFGFFIVGAAAAFTAVNHNDVVLLALVSYIVIESLAVFFSVICFFICDPDSSGRHFAVEVVPLYLIFFLGTFVANVINAFHTTTTEFAAYIFEAGECFFQSMFLLTIFSHTKFTASRRGVVCISFSAGYFLAVNLFWFVLDLVEKFDIMSLQAAIMQPLLVALVVDFRLHSIMFWLTVVAAVSKVGDIDNNVFTVKLRPDPPAHAPAPGVVARTPPHEPRVFFFGLAFAVVASFPIAIAVLERNQAVADAWQLGMSASIVVLLPALLHNMHPHNPNAVRTSVFDLAIFILLCFGTATADFINAHVATDAEDWVRLSASLVSGFEACFQGLVLFLLHRASAVEFSPWWLVRFLASFMAVYDVCQVFVNIFVPFHYTNSALDFILIACLIDFRLHAALYLIHLASTKTADMEFLQHPNPNAAALINPVAHSVWIRLQEH